MDPRFSLPPRARRLLAAGTLHTLAVWLVLGHSFVSFLQFHDYSLTRPEILIGFVILTAVSVGAGLVAAFAAPIGVVALAAVLTFYVDVQFFEFDLWVLGHGELTWLGVVFLALTFLLWFIRTHASLLVALTAGTAMIGAFALPGTPAAAGTSAPPGRPSDLPLIVHVVLDGHAGLQAAPAVTGADDLRSGLRSFYRANGFRVFGRAYSEFDKTELSLAHLLNFSTGRYRPGLLNGGQSGAPHRLTRNAYFELMARRGYALHVYQTDWMTFCPAGDLAAVCHTYTHSQAAPLQDAPLTVSQKASLLAGLYFRRSKLRARADAWQLPDSDWFHRMSTINSLVEARRVIRDLATARRGQFYFVHLLAPHGPFVYDAECALLPLNQWADEDARIQARLAGYQQQARCTQRIVEQMLGAIPARLRSDAVFVVHGDHGTRFSTSDVLTPAVFDDRYSVLLAMRIPGVTATNDSRVAPLSCVLEAAATSGFRTVGDFGACAADRVVFTRAGGRIERAPVPVAAGDPEAHVRVRPGRRRR